MTDGVSISVSAVRTLNTYLERVRVVAGQAIEVSGIDNVSAGNATGLIAGVTSLVGKHREVCAIASR
ncbi:hypothetical protein [Mycolicibacterium elephantis]|uniref:hypothetical protein n=1 Tax=Mycolicibacterium elephantis TaxID=81858 RepID=UPI0010424B74|nr:hypothetical protein [Mycolicibacterium elephantis]